jgi:hypothetical protein
MAKAFSTRGLARWTILVLGIGLALVYLNSAAYSWWASWGPPTSVPAAWQHRAQTHLCYAGTILLFAFALFRALRPSSRADRWVWISFVLGVVIATVPHVAEFLAGDVCIDRGGRWNSPAHRCEWSDSAPKTP